MARALAVALVLAVASAEPALASEKMHKLHKRMDKNSDGKVSMTELLDFGSKMKRYIANNNVVAIMNIIDTNKDGKLSLEEHVSQFMDPSLATDESSKEALRQERKVEAEKFRIADANKDNFLVGSEVASLFTPHLEDAVHTLHVGETLKHKDSNKDGKLSFEEFWYYESLNKKLTEQEKKADFDALDTDKDGGLSLKELKVWESGYYLTEKAMKKLLDVADGNNDKHLTAHEMATSNEDIAMTEAHAELIEWEAHSAHMEL